LNRRLIRILKRSDDDSDTDIPNIFNLDVSWRNWLVWRFFNKQALPFSGGFMEQPIWIIDDMMKIESEYLKIKEQLDGN